MNKYMLILILLVLILWFGLNAAQAFCASNVPIINQNDLVDMFTNNGCIVIPNVLTNSECNIIINNIRNELSNNNAEFGDINSQHRRIDLKLPIEKMDKFIKMVYERLNDFVETVIPNSKIVECSSLISYPGAYAQTWHYDTIPTKNGASLISFGIALDDIDDSMGPLEVMMGSNKLFNIDGGEQIIEKLHKKHETKKYFKNYYKSVGNIKYEIEKRGGSDEYSVDDLINDEATEMLCRILGIKRVKCSCKKGSLIIWSSEVHHRGGENKSSKARPIFYFSLMGKGEPPIGATYSLKSKNERVYVKNL